MKEKGKEKLTIRLPPRPRLRSIKIPSIRHQPARLDVLEAPTALAVVLVAAVARVVALQGGIDFLLGRSSGAGGTGVAAVLLGDDLERPRAGAVKELVRVVAYIETARGVVDVLLGGGGVVVGRGVRGGARVDLGGGVVAGGGGGRVGLLGGGVGVWGVVRGWGGLVVRGGKGVVGWGVGGGEGDGVVGGGSVVGRGGGFGVEVEFFGCWEGGLGKGLILGLWGVVSGCLGLVWLRDAYPGCRRRTAAPWRRRPSCQRWALG